MLDPETKMVTEGDEEVKRLRVRVNNSNVDIISLTRATSYAILKDHCLLCVIVIIAI